MPLGDDLDGAIDHLEATLLEGVDRSSAVYREEAFGPPAWYQIMIANLVAAKRGIAPADVPFADMVAVKRLLVDASKFRPRAFMRVAPLAGFDELIFSMIDARVVDLPAPFGPSRPNISPG